MYKICFFVPDTHLETVKNALFEVGAGTIGDYEHCCWQALGKGQFRPRANANPFLGKPGELEQVDEWKVELVCEDRLVKQTIAALKLSHPYEEVAFDLIRLEDPDQL